MEAVILVIHLIVALAIIATVLVQPSEAGGFLGSSGSMSNMTAPRRSGDVLTRLTTILAGVFFATSLTLAIIAERGGDVTRQSILDEAAEPPVTKHAPQAAPKTGLPKKEKPSAPISK